MDKEVRVRFAPSPTGPLHIGGLRTALYNYLFARKYNGKMLLRIEDTDQNRFVPGAEDYIQEALEWCGIEIDEGPANPGPFAPYRQSDRKDVYRQYANDLIDKGYAYLAFDTPEELDSMRERLKEGRVINPQYNAITRSSMRNSLTMDRNEVEELIKAGAPFVVRLKVPGKEEIRFHDVIRGWVKVHSATIDDKVLVKSDGMPTYHLANVVDDHLMLITHVIRGEEWLPSAPLHVLLYRYLGWEKEMPSFAHLPLLLKPDGNGKLSKRDAQKHGFPIFPLTWHDEISGEKMDGFREAGYLPEAFLNFLAFLGWNPGTEKELFTLPELIETFSLERINKAGARFDIQKAKWFNQEYLKQKPDQELGKLLMEQCAGKDHPCDLEKAAKIGALMKGRITFPSDMFREGAFFFETPGTYDENVVQKKWNPEAAGFLQDLVPVIQTLENYTEEGVHDAVFKLLEQKNLKAGKIMPNLRLALTGQGQGVDLMGIMIIIGREQVLQRIEKALNVLPNQIKA
jgi:glutamyl-tRNA synthetase